MDLLTKWKRDYDYFLVTEIVGDFYLLTIIFYGRINHEYAPRK